MGGHGHQGDEVPEGVGVLQVSDRVPLLGVDEVREEDRIPGVDDVDYDIRLCCVPDEEDGGVVSHDVPVPLLCIKLDCKPPGISARISHGKNMAPSTVILT